MKPILSTLYNRVFLLSLVATSLLFLGIASPLLACGWNQSGGGEDYVPQRKDSQGIWANKSALSLDQAKEIVAGYVKKLNPDLQVGKVTDNGGFYEVEVVNAGKDIVQLLGVDKQSGRLILIN